jgi:glycosyltransferase involved in cell wall biosynthesis
LGPNGRRDIRRRFRTGGVWELPQPIDRTTFTPGDDGGLREELGVDEDQRMLLTVGRIDRRKGVETIRRVAPSTEDIWVVVGDGPMRETLIETTGVRTPGRVDHDEIVDYYRAADLYVHPSLHEGLPNVLLEATACGTPSIARDVGECETVATETFSDDDGLRAALDRTYGPVELDDRFDEDRLARRYASLLSEVAG